MPRVALIAFLLILPACSRYPQNTPDSVLTSAREMVVSGHAERLPDLIYADSKQMRELLTELGVVLGTLQDLAKAVDQAFPEEIAAARKAAEDAAKRGEATGLLARITGQSAGAMARRARRSPEEGEKMRQSFDLLMKEVFADPYGWLERSEGRLTVQTLTDDTAALLWDGKPVMGVGLTLKLEAGKWYLALPIPPVALPKSEEGWEIAGSACEVLNNLLLDLREDVRKRRVTRLEDLAHIAGEKAFLPAALIMLAYGKMTDEQKKDQAAPGTP